MNNLDPLEKLSQISNQVKLDEKSKDAIGQEVLQFVKNNPVLEKKMHWWSNLKTPAVVLAGLLLFVGAGGIASVQADASLPGEFLYPVKVGFNEKVKELLAFSDEEKLELNIKLTEVRLKEAEQLMTKNKMNIGHETEISGKFRDRANKASIYIEKINQKKQDKKEKKTERNERLEKAEIKFEASLKAQKVILDEVQKKSDSKVTESFIKDIDEVTSKISEKILERKEKNRIDVLDLPEIED